MSKHLGTEQAAVDMSRFVVAPEPAQSQVKFTLAPKPTGILPRLNQLKSFGRSSIVYIAIPSLAILSVSCSSPSEGINNSGQISAAANAAEKSSESTAKEQTALPNFNVNPHLYENLGIKDSDPDKDAVLQRIFAEILKDPIRIMNGQFGIETTKKANIAVSGEDSIYGYVFRTTIDGNDYVIIMSEENETAGAWVRLPVNAKLDTIGNGVEVYQLKRGIIFMPMFRVDQQPFDNRIGMLIKTNGLRPDYIQKSNFWLTEHSNQIIEWSIRRSKPGVSYVLNVVQYGTDLKREIIATDLAGKQEIFSIAEDGVIAEKTGRP